MSIALFSPFTLRKLKLANRIVVSPMSQYSAVDGCATDRHFVHWGQLLQSGRAMLWDPRWPWHAAAVLGAQIQAPKQYWRSPPRETPNVIAHAKVGMR
jgi:2,4-dienoyl-CoA reductase-like NADH-dependent reductase (Old Yellow Enzyme family)